MHTLLLKTKTTADAKLLAAFLSTVKTIESVSIDPIVVVEREWVNPLNPISETEVAGLLKKSEQSPRLAGDEAKKYSKALIKRWSKAK